MATLPVYPLDLTGAAASNKIAGEIKTITRDSDRVFIPTGGPFYTKSLRVYSGNTLLQPIRDYKALELNRDGTVDSGKEVCNVLLITNAATSFRLEYQVIGGGYSDLSNELIGLINSTPINKLRVLTWGSILNKPTTFPPTAHKHYPYEWRGYTQVIHLLEQIRQAVIAGDASAIAAVYDYIDNNIKNIASDYIEANGLLFIDRTPTANGNVLLRGLGTRASPIGIDLEQLLNELDARYFQNVINPLSRIGAISDSFLPMSAGFFNCLCPLEEAVSMSAVGNVERNGDLLTLTPATNGAIIRYVYGYVRGWTNDPNIVRFRPTNQQYRPPGLAENEEIMDLFGYHEQSMIAAIYAIAEDGKATFKENAVIWLNGTLAAESHVLVRLGQELRTAIGNSPGSLYLYYPMMVKLRRGEQYLVWYYPQTNSTTSRNPCTISVYSFSEQTKKFTKVTNWKGIVQRNVIDPNTTLDIDNIVSTTETNIANGQDQPMPFYWFKAQVPVGNELPWIIDEELKAAPGTTNYSYSAGLGRSSMAIRVVGDTIKIMATLSNQVWVNAASGPYMGGGIDNWGFSMELTPLEAIPTYRWIRHRRSNDIWGSGGINEETGKLDVYDSNSYMSKPRDMISDYQWWENLQRRTRVTLNDGRVLFWAHPSSYGADIFMRSPRYGVPINKPHDIERMFQMYFNTKYWTMYEHGRGSTVSIGKETLNFPAPTVNGVQVTAIPLASGIVLHHNIRSDPRGANWWDATFTAYKPSSRIIDYPTSTNGILQGYDTSNDRIKLVGDYDGFYDIFPFVSVKHSGNQIKVGALAWYRPTDNTWTNQTAFANVDVDWNGKQLIRTQPYTFTRAGYNAVEDFVKSKLAAPAGSTLLHYTWTILASSTDPSAAMLWVYAGQSVPMCIERMYGLKLTFDDSGQLTGIAFSDTHFYQNQFGAVPVSVGDPRYAYGRLQWAIEYTDPNTGYWTGKRPNWSQHRGDTLEHSAILLFRQTKDGNGVPQFTYLAGEGTQNGSASTSGMKALVATPRGVGLMTDTIGYGVYRALQRIKTADYVSGTIYAADAPFIWTTPRPPENFMLTITDTIEVQLGGVYGRIEPANYALTDPVVSDIVDPRNKTIYIYVTLDLGVPKVNFRETPLAESVYTTYIGQCITDEYGILEADILPLTRIGNYRPSATPRGSAFSVSSGTADQQRLLNWDANVFGSDGGSNGSDGTLIDVASGSTPGQVYSLVVGPGEKFKILLLGPGGGAGGVYAANFNTASNGGNGQETYISVTAGIIMAAGGGFGGTMSRISDGENYSGERGKGGSIRTGIAVAHPFEITGIRNGQPIYPPTESVDTAGSPGIDILGTRNGWGGKGVSKSWMGGGVQLSGGGGGGSAIEFNILNTSSLDTVIQIHVGIPGGGGIDSSTGERTESGENGYFNIKRYV